MMGQSKSGVFLLTLLLFSAATGPSPASAAEIRPSTLPGCSIELSGAIVAGDHGAFMREAQAAGLVDGGSGGEARNSVNQALCLNSAGGSFQEGRLIAEKVHSLGISTRVREDAHCLSACANIFMAGRSLGDEVDGPSRMLHIGGQLGFHAPYILLPTDEPVPPAQVEQIVVGLNLLLSDFIRFGGYSSVFNSRPMFSLSLFHEMLAQGPNEVALVDTVDKAARWGIGLAGHKEEHELSDEQRVQACVNFLAWALDRPSEQAHETFSVSDRVTHDSFWPAPVTFAVVEIGGYAPKNCSIEITKGPAPGILVCTFDGFNGLLHGDCNDGMAHWVEWFWGLPPDTRLADFPR